MEFQKRFINEIAEEKNSLFFEYVLRKVNIALYIYTFA